jgi:hypothetical protein
MAATSRGLGDTIHKTQHANYRLAGLDRYLSRALSVIACNDRGEIALLVKWHLLNWYFLLHHRRGS